MNSKTVHIVVQGKVQGVFYRATTKEIADKIGVKGWVRNKKDGCVEITAVGSEQQIQEFIGWCKKGPDRAQVTNLIVTNLQDQDFKDFQVIRK
jgi:acylphosphatase